jgi:hypothetical protein
MISAAAVERHDFEFIVTLSRKQGRSQLATLDHR